MSVTDRQTTDGRATAYSEREREFMFAKNQHSQWTNTIHLPKCTFKFWAMITTEQFLGDHL